MKRTRVVRAAAAAALGTAALASPLATAPLASASTWDDAELANWPIGYFDLERTWDVTRGAGVTVGLVDGNVDVDHPDLAGQVAAQEYFGGDAGSASGHGTSMASLIVGSGAQLVQGISPDAGLVVAATGAVAPAIDADDEAIRWLVDQGVGVINLSYETGYSPRPDQQSAIEYALANDVVVVASNGDPLQGDTGITVPASYPGVIAVAAVDWEDALCGCSVPDELVTVAAPGFEVISAAPEELFDTGYFRGTGPSASAAIVSGVAALVRAEHPDLDAANVVNRIVATARDVGAPGRDPEFGFGIVDPYAAVTAEVPLVDANPLLPAGATPDPTDEPDPTPSESSTLGGGTSAPAPPSSGPAATTSSGLAGGTSSSSDGFPVAVVAGAAGGVVLIGVAVAFVARRRREDAAG